MRTNISYFPAERTNLSLALCPVLSQVKTLSQFNRKPYCPFWEPDEVKDSLNGAGPSLQLIVFLTGDDFCLLHISGSSDSVTISSWPIPTPRILIYFSINAMKGHDYRTFPCGSVAERSKALDLGSSLSRGVGSNPTAARLDACFCPWSWSPTVQVERRSLCGVVFDRRPWKNRILRLTHWSTVPTRHSKKTHRPPQKRSTGHGRQSVLPSRVRPQSAEAKTSSSEWRSYDIFFGAFSVQSMKTNITRRPSPRPHYLPSKNRATSNKPLFAENYPAFKRTATTTPHNPATATSARCVGSSTWMPSSHVRTESTRWTIHTYATRPTLSTSYATGKDIPKHGTSPRPCRRYDNRWMDTARQSPVRVFPSCRGTLQQSRAFNHRSSGKRSPRRPSRRTTTQNRWAETDSQIPYTWERPQPGPWVHVTRLVTPTIWPGLAKSY